MFAARANHRAASRRGRLRRSVAAHQCLWQLFLMAAPATCFGAVSRYVALLGDTWPYVSITPLAEDSVKQPSRKLFYRDSHSSFPDSPVRKRVHP